MKKMALTVLATAGILSSAQAFTYTAVASGNFSSYATWGITPPTGIITADQVIIPAGITVTLDNNVTFSGLSELSVNGTLTSSTNATAIIMTAGSLTGSGSIIVDSMATSLVSGITYTGTLAVDHLTTFGTTFGSNASVTVNNTLDVMAGLLNIMDGSVTLANNSTIIIDGGTIAVGGTGSIGLSNNYNVVYEGSSVVSGLELSGTGLQDLTLNLTSGTVTLTSDVTLDGTLSLTSGNLVLNNNDLTFGTNADIAATGTGSINSSAGSDITINATGGLTGDLMFGTGNSNVNNLTINLGTSSANVDLGSDVTVNGTLTLTTGTLTLNNNDLSFAANGNFAATGTGTIVSTTGSDISITSNNNFTGGIRFSTTGNTVNNLTINLGSNSSYASLSSDLKVNGALTLTAGKLNVGTYNLIINAAGSVSGGSANSYVITSNGGRLTMNLAANGSHTYHVGTMVHYAPAMIAANTGSVTSDLSVMADDSVYAAGTTGYNLANYNSIVNNTWFVTSTVSTGLDLNMQLMWSAAMEMNGFDRTQAYISHYTSGNWDVAATASATTSGSLYVINRNNITSLSPFTVADANSALAVNEVAAVSDVSVYPNPATDVVNFTSTKTVTNIAIYDVTGRKVTSMIPNGNSFSVSDLTPGYYSVQLIGKDFATVQSFIKK